MKSIELKDFYDIKSVFHPTVFYDGTIPLTRGKISNKDYFLFNSKKDGNKNLYQDFLDKYYFKPMGGVLNSDALAQLTTPQIIMTDGYSKDGRELHFSYGFFLNIFLSFHHSDLMNKLKTEVLSPVDLVNYEVEIKDALRSDRLMMSDVLKNGVNSEYHSIIKKELDEAYAQVKAKPDLKRYAQSRVDSLMLVGMAIKYCDSFFSKKINIDEFIACFDYDKFCLCTIMALLEANEVTEELFGVPDHTVIHLAEFVSAYEKLKLSNPKYNSYININEEAIIPAEFIVKRIKDFLVKHSNVAIFSYDEILKAAKTISDGNEDIDLSSKVNAKLIEEVEEFLFDTKDIRATWEFLPSGEITNNAPFSRTSSYTRGIKDPEARMIAEEERMARYNKMMECKSYLEEDEVIKAHQLITLKGINKFAGYVAYVFANGKVVLEQYFTDENQQKVAKEKATYVMSIFEFVELSKKNKLDLIALINQLKTKGVKDISLKRIPHYEPLARWKMLILEIVTTGSYSKKVADYIKLLISQNLLVYDETDKTL